MNKLTVEGLIKALHKIKSNGGDYVTLELHNDGGGCLKIASVGDCDDQYFSNLDGLFDLLAEKLDPQLNSEEFLSLLFNKG